MELDGDLIARSLSPEASQHTESFTSIPIVEVLTHSASEQPL
jgi:hypothetical protein